MDDNMTVEDIPPHPKNCNLNNLGTTMGKTKTKMKLKIRRTKTTQPLEQKLISSMAILSPLRNVRNQTTKVASVTTKEGSIGGSEGLATKLTLQELRRQWPNCLHLYYSGGSFYGVPAS
jgi:hypothetical protein